MSDYLERTNGGQTFTGSDVNLFAYAVLANALAFYAKTGRTVNRLYTPQRMLHRAHLITGQIFTGRTKYLAAAQALNDKVQEMKREPRTIVEA